MDTGLFYRAVTALALLEGVALDDVAGLVPLVDRVTLGDDGTGRLTRVLLDGMDATEEARSGTVDGFVSAVARLPEVRAALLERQRELADAGGIVVAGRDIGTVVLPDADLKLFLDASVEERAARRIHERGLDPDGDEAEDVREQLRVRDAIDTGRAVAPLRAADDAVHVVTDGNAFDDTVEIVAAEIARVMLTPRKARRARPKASGARTAAAAAAAAAAIGAAPEPDAASAVVAAELEPEPVAEASTAPEPVAEAEAAISAEPEAEPEPVAAVVTRKRRTRKPTKAAAPKQAPAVESVPDEVPHDPGPFAVGAAVAAAGVANGAIGPFAVASDVDVAFPAVPEPEPVDPGPFAVDVVAGTHVAHPVVGPFAVATEADVELPAVLEPEPVDPGPFAVAAAARRRPSPTLSSARSPSRLRSTSTYPPYPSPSRSTRARSP